MTTLENTNKLSLYKTKGSNNLISIQSSRGSVFENFIRKNSLELLGVEESALQGKLVNVMQEGNGTYKVIIDDHYIIEAANGKSLTIGIEMKNIVGKLTGKQLEQFANYDILLQEGKISKIEYIFSNKSAAELNKKLFSDSFKGVRLKEYDIKYIEKGQIFTLIK